MTDARYSVGQRVVLPALPAEDIPREIGVVEEVQSAPWFGMYIVRVPALAGDDGLREVHEDNIEGPA